MEGFRWIDSGVLVIYLVGVLFGGLWFCKKEDEGKEFLKGEGSIGWWVSCVCIFGSLLSGI